MGGYTSDIDMCSEDDSSTSNSVSNHRRRRRKDKATCKKRRSCQKKDISTDSCSSSNDPDFDIRSSISHNFYSEDRRRRHRTTSKRKKKRRLQKQSFYGDSSSSSSDPDFNIRSSNSSDSDCDIRSRSCRSKSKREKSNGRMKKRFTNSSCSSDFRDTENSNSHTDSSMDREVSRKIVALAQELAELQRQLDVEKEIASNSQETEEELYWLHQLLQVEPEEAVAKGLSLEVDYSESISELDDSFTCSAIAAEPSSVQRLVIVAAENETEAESFDSECANEWLPDAKSNFSLQVNASHTSTTSELGESIVGISTFSDAEEKPAEKNGKGAPQDDNQFGKKLLHTETTIEEKLEAEVSFDPRLAELEGQIGTFVFKGVTWNLWRAMRAHGRKVFGLLPFMEEIGLLLRRVVEPQVDLKLEEKFLDSMSRKRLLRLGYHGGCVGNREGGEDKPEIHNLSLRQHGSIAGTTVGVEASRVAVRNHTKSTHGLTMKVWNPNSWEETTILSGILVTWKGLCTLCEVCTLDRGGDDPATNGHRKTFNSRRMEDRERISLQWRARYFGWLYDNCKGLLLNMLMWIGPFRAKEIV
ncbi:hypothetical protein R1sor_009012 [Riccia sorocarpa]|uniref:Uncharacterized protein n=1 Tax=Riccia sorocarpa TaxID=122646 RepID=A0ABD3H562_9MARC